jgi:Spy/CpxP family protein refolding chaperone
MKMGRFEYSRGRQILFLTGLFGLLLVICVGVSLLTTRWIVHGKDNWEHDQPHGHQWLHEELRLTEAEETAIDAFEGGYRRERGELLETFNERIADLREILVTQDAYSDDVDLAIHRIHEVHGQLQELSIAHYYDMLSVLPPEKQEKLRQLAVKALSQPE